MGVCVFVRARISAGLCARARCARGCLCMSALVCAFVILHIYARALLYVFSVQRACCGNELCMRRVGRWTVAVVIGGSVAADFAGALTG